MNHDSGDASAEGVKDSASSQERIQDSLKATIDNLSLTKIEKSLTKNNIEDGYIPPDNVVKQRRPGRPPRTTKAPVTWSVRGVSPETRAVLEQGAAHVGKPMGQFINEDICTSVMRNLKGIPDPALVPLAEEIQYLRQLVENLTKMIEANSPEDNTLDV